MNGGLLDGLLDSMAFYGDGIVFWDTVDLCEGPLPWLEIELEAIDAWGAVPVRYMTGVEA